MNFSRGISVIRSGARPGGAPAVWRGALTAATAAATVALGAVPAAAAPAVPVRPVTVEFRYIGPHSQDVTVPAGIHTAQVRVIGGHGGSTGGTAEFVTGGDGAQITGDLPVYPGELLRLYVAGRGHDNDGLHAGPGGWGATGYGGHGGRGGLFSYGGAGGGGASAITDTTNRPVLAGGGGGGAGTGFSYPIDAGGPGGSSGVESGGDPGHDGRGPGHGYGGSGGTELGGAGGAGGDSAHNAGGGGGGGAGLRGGGGGSGGGFGGGGGGGGGAGSWDYLPFLRDAHVSRGTTSDGDGRIFISWLSGTGVGTSSGENATIVPFDAQGDALTSPGSPGQPVQLAPKSGSPGQVWTITNPGNPAVTQIVSKQTGLCLGVASYAAGAEAIAATCDGSASQQWAQAGLTNGSYRLYSYLNPRGNLVLTPEVGSANLELEPFTSGTLQGWLLQPTS